VFVSWCYGVWSADGGGIVLAKKVVEKKSPADYPSSYEERVSAWLTRMPVTNCEAKGKAARLNPAALPQIGATRNLRTIQI